MDKDKKAKEKTTTIMKRQRKPHSRKQTPSSQNQLYPGGTNKQDKITLQRKQMRTSDSNKPPRIRERKRIKMASKLPRIRERKRISMAKTSPRK